MCDGAGPPALTGSYCECGRGQGLTPPREKPRRLGLVGLVLGKASLGDLEAHSLLGLNCIPQNSYVEVLTPRTSEYDVTWKQGPCRCGYDEAVPE